MVDIQSATAEIRGGKKERRLKKPQGRNVGPNVFASCISSEQVGHKEGKLTTMTGPTAM